MKLREIKMEKVTKWGITDMYGYEPITDVYADLGRAENYGLSGVIDAYVTALGNYRDNYKTLTELVMALNWKSHEHTADNPVLSELYDTLFFSLRKYALNNLEGEELRYFIATTD